MILSIAASNSIATVMDSSAPGLCPLRRTRTNQRAQIQRVLLSQAQDQVPVRREPHAIARRAEMHIASVSWSLTPASTTMLILIGEKSAVRAASGPRNTDSSVPSALHTSNNPLRRRVFSPCLCQKLDTAVCQCYPVVHEKQDRLRPNGTVAGAGSKRKWRQPPRPARRGAVAYCAVIAGIDGYSGR